MAQDSQSDIQVQARRVLVAEFDEAIRSAWSAQLVARCGPVTVLEASCGSDAVRLLLDERLDLVVVSLRLPEGLMANPQGGFQVILDAADLGIPAVLVSGPLDEVHRGQLDHLGVLCVLRDDALGGVGLAGKEALARYAPSPTSARQASWSRSARSAIAS